MDKTLPLDVGMGAPPHAPNEYQSAIAQIFAEMSIIDARIEQNQAETAELRAETRLMLDQLRAA